MWMDFDQLLNLPNVTVVNYQKIDEKIFLKLNLLNETIECPNCHQTLDTINQTEYNLVRDLSILGNNVYLEVPRRQFYCSKCDKYITERLSFMKLRQHHTIRYESMIYTRVKNSSIEEVSHEQELGWEEVQSIFNKFARALEKQTWDYPKRISLDEFSNKKGHKEFITTVVNLDNKNLLNVINGHKQEELIEELKSQPEAVRAKVEEVSVDMWEGFTVVINTLFPNAKIIYDRFHVMDIINDELNQLRKMMNVHTKGLPHLLWKNQEDLDEEQKQRLENILTEHPCLRIAYEMKEEIRRIYESSRTVSGAQRRFEKWIRLGGILYRRSANMIQNHLTGICNYFENHTTNGITEGINTKIKLIKRISYGFTNFENLKLKLFACFNS
jgi:transposase